MKIYEITKTLSEAVPGSFAGQAGVFGKSVMGALGQRFLPNANTAQSPGDGVSDVKAQGAAARASAQTVNALAVNQQQMWSRALTDLMTKARNTRTNQIGVQSVKDLPRNDIERALNSQVNATLQKVSGNKVKDYEQLVGAVDAAAYSGKGREAAQRAVNELKKALGTILSTEPSKEQAPKLSRLWQVVAEKIYTAAGLVTFQPSATQQEKDTQITIGGKPLDPNNPKNAKIITAVDAMLKGQP